jgi:hypothetical protein
MYVDSWIQFFLILAIGFLANGIIGVYVLVTLFRVIGWGMDYLGLPRATTPLPHWLDYVFYGNQASDDGGEGD